MLQVNALQRHQIDEKNQEVMELTEVWRISESDLRMERVLDAGTFGRVWLAQWGDYMVAVKQLHGKFLDDAQVGERNFNPEGERCERPGCR